MSKKVFVSGCYDLLHSGHVEFFKQASSYGDLYVGIGSDKTIEGYKHHRPMFPEEERLFMVKAVRYVTEAYINQGSGVLDFLPTLDIVKPDILVVNSDGGNDDKRRICEERGIEYVVLERVPHEGLEARSSSDLKKQLSEDGQQAQPEKPGCKIPTRVDIAGTWIDQPYVSQLCPGWAITLSIEPTFEIRERCGLATSTRNQIMSIWPYRLPKMDPETLARLVFCFENHPERQPGHVSGAQDALGICMPGLARHYYNNHFWPDKVENCVEAGVLAWLEGHLCLVPMEPRRPRCTVVAGRDVTEAKVRRLAAAAEDCWSAIMAKDLHGFASAFSDSFDAQIAMFPAMIQGPVQPAIDHWSEVEGVLAWKLTGAGGGGYLLLVVENAASFAEAHPEAITICVRNN